jgi:hypothetical protein
MKTLKDINITEDWLQTIYAEAWRQYNYEDNLSYSKLNIFWIIESAFLIGLAALIQPLEGITGPSITMLGRDLPRGSLILSIMMIVIGGVLSYLSLVWRSVAISGRQYVNLRWYTIWAIEKKAKLEDISLARQEDEYRKTSAGGERYKIYQNIEELCEEKYLNPLPRNRNWISIEATPIAFLVISVAIFIGGIFLFWLG